MTPLRLLSIVLLGTTKIVSQQDSTPIAVFHTGFPIGTSVLTGVTKGVAPGPPTTLKCRQRGVSTLDSWADCDVSSLAGTGKGLSLIPLGEPLLSGGNLPDPTQSISEIIGAERGWSIPSSSSNATNVPYTVGFGTLSSAFPWQRASSTGEIPFFAGANGLVGDLCFAEGSVCTSLTSAHRQQVSAETRAWLTWFGVTPDHRRTAQDCVAFGTWNTPPQNFASFGRFSNAAGATLTCTVHQATRLDIITTVSHTSSPSTFTIQVDGNPVTCGWPAGSTLCSNAVDDAPATSSSQPALGIVDTTIRNLPLGDHTVSVAVANAGSPLGILGVAGSTPTDPKPFVLISYANRVAQTSLAYPARQDALVSEIDTDEAQDFTALQADGFQVLPVHLDCLPGGEGAQCWEPNDASQTSSWGDVPNTNGSANAARGVLAQMSSAGW